MTKTTHSVIPRSKLTAHMPPGAATPRSGVYPPGGRTNEQADLTRGKPLPPTDGPGRGWKLIPPAHHKSGK